MRYADEHGHYELNPFPGCSQVIVSNHAFIEPRARGKGLGRSQHVTRLGEAERLGYDYILCTTRADNVQENRILRLYGWSLHANFTNSESGAELYLWGKVLTHPKPESPEVPQFFIHTDPHPTTES